LSQTLTAENLPPLGSNGTCDPYCTLAVGDEKQTTKIAKQSLTPSWNEEFVLATANSELSLRIDLYHQDSRSFIGGFTIPLTELTHQKRFASWRAVELSSEAKKKKI